MWGPMTYGRGCTSTVVEDTFVDCRIDRPYYRAVARFLPFPFDPFSVFLLYFPRFPLASNSCPLSDGRACLGFGRPLEGARISGRIKVLCPFLMNLLEAERIQEII